MENYSDDWNLPFIQITKDIRNIDLCLEIGCFEGLTSKYIVNNLLKEGGKLICVDPLTDNYLNDNLTEKDINNNNTIYGYFNNQYERFTTNCKEEIKSEKIYLFRDLSSNVFPILLEDLKDMFDLIYVDGDHRADTVYNDAINSYSLCKNSGYILFDDYTWGDDYGENRPSVGIDKFLKEYEGRYKIVNKNYQLLIQKNDIPV